MASCFVVMAAVFVFGVGPWPGIVYAAMCLGTAAILFKMEAIAKKPCNPRWLRDKDL
jgi:hypothetical protein